MSGTKGIDWDMVDRVLIEVMFLAAYKKYDPTDPGRLRPKQFRDPLELVSRSILNHNQQALNPPTCAAKVDQPQPPPVL